MVSVCIPGEVVLEMIGPATATDVLGLLEQGSETTVPLTMQSVCVLRLTVAYLCVLLCTETSRPDTQTMDTGISYLLGPTYGILHG